MTNDLPQPGSSHVYCFSWVCEPLMCCARCFSSRYVLSQSGYGHLCGRSLVCDRRWAARRAGRLKVLGQPGNVHWMVLRSEARRWPFWAGSGHQYCRRSLHHRLRQSRSSRLSRSSLVERQMPEGRGGRDSRYRCRRRLARLSTVSLALCSFGRIGLPAVSDSHFAPR